MDLKSEYVLDIQIVEKSSRQSDLCVWSSKDGLGCDTSLEVLDNINIISAMRLGKITDG